MPSTSVFKFIREQINNDRKWLLDNQTMLFEMSKTNKEIREQLQNCFPIINFTGELDMCMNIQQFKKL